ncbi:MAG: tetratricopeptide repeat protein, partial [candidate division NC10 bacterium]|nr:tetratricopeptide repeat protein [candidate division NC10 bacterium]
GLGIGGLTKGRLLVLLLGAMTLFSFLHLTSLIKVYASSLHLHRGTEQLLRGDLPGAAASFERALEVNPRDPEIHGALASAYASLGMKEGAIELAKRGKHGFSSPGLYRFLGGLHYDLGNFQEAEKEYQEGIAIFPGHAPLHAAYGALLAKVGRYPEALASLLKAKALDPSYPDTYHYLGYLYSLTRQPREALFAFREFLRFADPRDPRLGQVRALMGRLREGRGGSPE